LSYFAAGAVIENIAIAASANGYQAEIGLFPSSDPNHVASVELTPHPEIKSDSLSPEIFLRATNRKSFLPMTISDAEHKELTESVGLESEIHTVLITARLDVKKLAELIALEDRLIFSNKAVHDFFYGHINWTTENDKVKKTGQHIKTLELQPFITALYFALQDWGVSQFATQIRVDRFLADFSKFVYQTAAGIGCVTIPTDTPQDFVKAGRGFERLWLTATKLGFSLQPLYGIPYLKLRLDSREITDFSAEQKAAIESNYKSVKQMFGDEGRRLACIFRIGGGASPSARSLRRDLVQIVTTV
jgi:hypothetical protein